METVGLIGAACVVIEVLAGLVALAMLLVDG